MSRTWTAAHEPPGAHVAAKVASLGGTVADAAIAGALAQGAAEPLWTSLGGFGVALVHDGSTGRTRSIGFHAHAPLAASETLFGLAHDDEVVEATPGAYEVPGRINQIGYLAVGTPGLPAGLAALHADYGRLSLPDVLEPAAELLVSGAAVSRHVYSTWASDDRPGYEPPLRRLTATPAAAAIYGKTGALPLPGSRLANPDYAWTLRELGKRGLEDFYVGSIGARISADFAANGGLLSSEDLGVYAVDRTQPVTSRYRDLEIRTPPAPSLTEQLHLALAALAERGLSKVDPLSPQYVESVALALTQPVSGRPAFANPDAVGRHTTHIICVNDEGDVVTMTHSLGAASGVVTPGLGFLYNGALHRFDPRPGRPTSIRPGLPRPTGMAPTVILRDGSAQLVAGGAGGLGIIQGVVQALLAVIEHGSDPQIAVSAPRFAAYGKTIRLEAGFPRATATDLRRRGFDVIELPDALDRHDVGRVVLASRLHSSTWRAAADPRGGGVAVVS